MDSNENVKLKISDDFEEWLIVTIKKVPVILASLGIGISIVPSIVFSLIESRFQIVASQWKYFLIASYLCHPFILAILTFLIPQYLTNATKDSKIKRALKEFRRSWRALYFTWFILYVHIAVPYVFLEASCFENVDKLKECINVSKEYYWIFSNKENYWIVSSLLNNLQTASLFFCYAVITKHTKKAKDKFEWSWTYLIILVCVFSLAEVITIYLLKAGSYQIWFMAISGGLAGIAIALLLGRLDSKFIGLPLWVVSFLYFYALIQIFWLVFPENQATKTILINFALILKILLFLVGYWLLKSGVLDFFLRKIEDLDRVSDDRRTHCMKLQLPDQ